MTTISSGSLFKFCMAGETVAGTAGHSRFVNTRSYPAIPGIPASDFSIPWRAVCSRARSEYDCRPLLIANFSMAVRQKPSSRKNCSCVVLSPPRKNQPASALEVARRVRTLPPFPHPPPTTRSSIAALRLTVSPCKPPKFDLQFPVSDRVSAIFEHAKLNHTPRR